MVTGLLGRTARGAKKQGPAYNSSFLVQWAANLLSLLLQPCLPALGKSVKRLPVRLGAGAAAFTWKVQHFLEQKPLLRGRHFVHRGIFAWKAQHFDSQEIAGARFRTAGGTFEACLEFL